jgi:hypothetical protein
MKWGCHVRGKLFTASLLQPALGTLPAVAVCFACERPPCERPQCERPPQTQCGLAARSCEPRSLIVVGLCIKTAWQCCRRSQPARGNAFIAARMESPRPAYAQQKGCCCSGFAPCYMRAGAHPSRTTCTKSCSACGSCSISPLPAPSSRAMLPAALYPVTNSPWPNRWYIRC